MQPYIFPYIGYFQLMYAVDKFILYDDVDYINRGWINRNNILVNKQATLFTIPLVKASQNKAINTIEVLDEAKWKGKMLKTIALAYKKAPFFKQVSELVEEVITPSYPSIAAMVEVSIRKTVEYLKLNVEIQSTSAVYQNQQLKAAERILDICHQEEATAYINPVGGQELYQKDHFLSNGVRLNFLKAVPLPYPQGKHDFIPYLSIIDLMMQMDPEEILSQHLPSFELL